MEGSKKEREGEKEAGREGKRKEQMRGRTLGNHGNTPRIVTYV
jgi:hypothetical protein